VHHVPCHDVAPALDGVLCLLERERRVLVRLGEGVKALYRLDGYPLGDRGRRSRSAAAAEVVVAAVVGRRRSRRDGSDSEEDVPRRVGLDDSVVLVRYPTPVVVVAPRPALPSLAYFFEEFRLLLQDPPPRTRVVPTPPSFLRRRLGDRGIGGIATPAAVRVETRRFVGGGLILVAFVLLNFFGGDNIILNIV